MTALSVGLYYLESLIPPIVPVPGSRLGLANLILLFVLYYYDGLSYLFVMILKVLIVALIGQGFSVPFLMSSMGSLFAAVISLFLFYVVKPSIYGVSAAGSVFHTIGQLLVYALFFENFYIFAYFSVLGPIALATGLLIAFLDQLLIRRLPSSFRNEERVRRR